MTRGTSSKLASPRVYVPQEKPRVPYPGFLFGFASLHPRVTRMQETTRHAAAEDKTGCVRGEGGFGTLKGCPAVPGLIGYAGTAFWRVAASKSEIALLYCRQRAQNSVYPWEQIMYPISKQSFDTISIVSSPNCWCFFRLAVRGGFVSGI